MSRFLKFAFLAAALLVSCKGNEYSELESLLKQQNSVQETFIKKIDKADTAEKVEKAINDFNEAINGIHSEISAYASSNPEFENIINRITEPPRELAEEISTGDELADSFFDTLKKISRYVTDSGVEKAVHKMEEFIKDIDKR